MTAGLFFEAVWLVNGNGTSTTSPNSKGIVDVVFRIVPDYSECRSARRGSGAGQCLLLLAQADEVDEILDLGDPLGRQRLDFLNQGLGIGGHCYSLAKLTASYSLSTRIQLTLLFPRRAAWLRR